MGKIIFKIDCSVLFFSSMHAFASVPITDTPKMIKGTCKNGKDVKMIKFTEIQIIGILMVNGSGIF
jgi:hypothetical protein